MLLQMSYSTSLFDSPGFDIGFKLGVRIQKRILIKQKTEKEKMLEHLTAL